jgi:hypothetical protein
MLVATRSDIIQHVATHRSFRSSGIQIRWSSTMYRAGYAAEDAADALEKVTYCRSNLIRSRGRAPQRLIVLPSLLARDGAANCAHTAADRGARGWPSTRQGGDTSARSRTKQAAGDGPGSCRVTASRQPEHGAEQHDQRRQSHRVLFPRKGLETPNSRRQFCGVRPAADLSNWFLQTTETRCGDAPRATVISLRFIVASFRLCVRHSWRGRSRCDRMVANPMTSAHHQPARGWLGRDVCTHRMKHAFVYTGRSIHRSAVPPVASNHHQTLTRSTFNFGAMQTTVCGAS